MPDVLTLTLGRVRPATRATRILEADLGDMPFHFRAGQAVIMGVHGHPVRQPYSIASAPTDVSRHRRLEFLVSIDGTGYNRAHLGRLQPGVKLDIEGPCGSFILPDALDPRHRLLFIGGGTGIAPLRSMIREALARRHRAPMTLVYSARTPADLAYVDELRRLTRGRRLRVVLAVTRTWDPRWRGERGRIGRPLIERLVRTTADGGPGGSPAGAAQDVAAFLCGPPAFVSDLAEVVRLAGVPAGRVHTEHWHA